MRWPMLVLAVVAAAADGAARTSRPKSIEPWVEVKQGTPSACGVRFIIETEGDDIEVGLRLEKRDGDLDLVLSGRSLAAKTFEGPVAIATTQNDLRPMPENGEASETGWIVRAPARSAEVGPYMQTLMIGGGTITLGRKPRIETVVVPGPLPQAVRASYLNCAGDLYRP